MIKRVNILLIYFFSIITDLQNVQYNDNIYNLLSFLQINFMIKYTVGCVLKQNRGIDF